jgi:hypothetical protein
VFPFKTLVSIYPTGGIMKLNEDWLAVIISFALMILAVVGVVGPQWMVF